MLNFNRFNEGRFVIPREHLGNPMRLPGADGNPFDDLDKASGCDNQDPDLAKAGNLTREVQQGVLAITMLVPRLVKDADLKIVGPFIENVVSARVGDGMFYAAADTGEDFFQGKVGFGMLQNIGTCDALTRGILADRRSVALEAADRHDDFLLRLIDSPRDGIILETGAGSDFDRIRKIQNYAQSVGAKLICHDTAPLASRRSVDYLDDVPYLALPSSSEILSLPFADLDRPLTLTLKNVVSSMAFGQIHELCEFAKNARARKILVTQSLVLARQNNMIPENWRFSGENFSSYVAKALMPELMRYGFSREEMRPFFSYVILQVQHVIEMVMMELAKRSMFQVASQYAGLKTDRIFNVEYSTVINGSEASEYLSKFYPHILQEFIEGKFNRVVVGPFGTNLSKDTTVGNGDLRVSSVRNHWEFARGRIAEIPPLKKTAEGSMTCTMASRTNIPREFLTINKDFSVATLRSLGLDVRALSELPDNKFREFHKLGARLALDIVFNAWARQYGHHHIQPFLGKVEKEMEDFFVKGI